VIKMKKIILASLAVMSSEYWKNRPQSNSTIVFFQQSSLWQWALTSINTTTTTVIAIFPRNIAARLTVVSAIAGIARTTALAVRFSQKPAAATAHSSVNRRMQTLRAIAGAGQTATTCAETRRQPEDVRSTPNGARKVVLACRPARLRFYQQNLLPEQPAPPRPSHRQRPRKPQPLPN
jgi:hypothetical protein